MNNTTLISVLVFSSLILVGAFLIMLKRKKYQKNGQKVKAVISDLSLESSDGRQLYYPFVKFITLEGIEVNQKHTSGSYPSVYHINENIDVIYLHDDHSNFIISSKKGRIIEMVLLLLGVVGMLFSLIKFFEPVYLS